MQCTRNFDYEFLDKVAGSADEKTLKNKTMSIKILNIEYDKVISSRFITASTTYEFALEQLVPLIDRLEIQRSLQNTKFYQRLEKDLVVGCIMPPITIAFIEENPLSIEMANIDEFLENNIDSGFILDGIQRLNTLSRTFNKYKGELDINRILNLNILICSSMDNLLYRMVTLNNGQKPMSARHQIEILTNNLFDFSESPVPIITEREKKKTKLTVAFDKDTLVKGYLAFLSNTTNIENKKIIESKLDELIADKILDSEITNDGLEFSNIISLINKYPTNSAIYKWLKNANNFIGFCVGIRNSMNQITALSEPELSQSIAIYEKAFSSFNYSQIKVGKYRRNLGAHFIKNIARMKNMDELDLIDELSQLD